MALGVTASAMVEEVAAESAHHIIHIRFTHHAAHWPASGKVDN